MGQQLVLLAPEAEAGYGAPDDGGRGRRRASDGVAAEAGRTMGVM